MTGAPSDRSEYVDRRTALIGKHPAPPERGRSTNVHVEGTTVVDLP
jgi:hypothetical protein